MVTNESRKNKDAVNYAAGAAAGAGEMFAQSKDQ